MIRGIQFKQNTHLASLAGSRLRSAGEVRQILKRASDRGIELTIQAPLRAVDGPGSSLDLRELYCALTPPDARDLDQVPSTPTIASDYCLKLTVSAASHPDVIEYVAPDYGATQERPDTQAVVCLDTNQRAPRRQRDAPAYIFANLFSLTGIRVELAPLPSIALAGGLETSSVFDLALLAAASVLSGAELTFADLVAAAVQIDRDVLEGPTGAQGHLAALLGGAYQHYWLNGLAVRDESSRPFNALSVSLVGPRDYPFYEARMALVQVGTAYVSGRPVINRTASMTERLWLDVLGDRDPVAMNLYERKVDLTERYCQAIRTRTMTDVIDAINQYVDIRDQLQRRWFELAVMDSAAQPAYARRYTTTLLTDELLQRYHCTFGSRISAVSLYSQSLESDSPFDPGRLIEAGRKCGLALMPLGAGGPGATIVAVAAGADELRHFFDAQGIQRLDDDEAIQTVHGTGVVRGYVPLKVARHGIQIRGFGELGLSLPEAAAHVECDPTAIRSYFG